MKDEEEDIRILFIDVFYSSGFTRVWFCELEITRLCSLPSQGAMEFRIG